PHETLVARAALAVPRAPRRAGPRRRTGRRPDAQARRHPQRDAGGRSTGLSGPRIVHDLRSLAALTLLLEPGALRSAQAAGIGGNGRARARRALVVAGQLPKPRLLSQKERPLARRPALHGEGREVHLRRRPRGAGRPGEAPTESEKRLVRQRRGHRDARRPDRDLQAQAASAVAPAPLGLGLLARLSRARPA